MAFDKPPLAVDPVEQHLSGSVKSVKPRRSHCKSRNGCLHCKQRRVKCDERHPVCGPCSKRQLLCSFLDQKNQNNTRRYSESSLRQSISSQGSAIEYLDEVDESVPSPYGSVRATELKLLHYYSTETYKTLVSMPKDQITMQYHVPELAFLYPFLMDSLLTLTAQHLATVETHRSSDWIRISMQYQNRSLENFTRTLENINSDNCSAVALCSMLISMTSIASSTNVDETLYSEWIYEFLGTRLLQRGIRNILTNYHQQLTTTGIMKDWFSQIIAHMINLRTQREPDYELEYEISPEQKVLYDKLMKSLSHLTRYFEWNQMPKQDTYINSCKMLATTLSFRSRRGIIISALSWPGLIDLNCLQPIESDIMSRAIFLHYGIVLHLINDTWYTHGAGLRLIKQMMWNVDDKSFGELDSIVLWIRDIIEG
ncbi:Sterol uptake control protein 2 [Erysiphe necator]|uniref:Putative c6 zinc finger domain protein n=1 Tax=Uncinula necator TaxID=52586 RepID=A0A0B1P8B4_UNCNE|nr:Sterol uptake control protein 2 [Erysiphe necator]KHJ34927.1 putative c6 zinc finger domain protein [Erysiphe necator]